MKTPCSALCCPVPVLFVFLLVERRQEPEEPDIDAVERADSNVVVSSGFLITSKVKKDCSEEQPFTSTLARPISHGRPHRFYSFSLCGIIPNNKCKIGVFLASSEERCEKPQEPDSDAVERPDEGVLLMLSKTHEM